MAAEFSAALCRGLIEATLFARYLLSSAGGFPRLYAAASLKQRIRGEGRHDMKKFSAALCRGLIEASDASFFGAPSTRFSAALCRGLIEADVVRDSDGREVIGFSAALCRGLIEARARRPSRRGPCSRFSAALCRGLIEAS